MSYRVFVAESSEDGGQVQFIVEDIVSHTFATFEEANAFATSAFKQGLYVASRGLTVTVSKLLDRKPI